MGCCFSVSQGTSVVVERFGAFDYVARPGLHFINPVTQSPYKTVSLRVESKSFEVETKTKDNVFVTILINIQYAVIPEKIRNAVYDLDVPLIQIEAYITSTLRSEVPLMDLDDAFTSKNDLAQAVEAELSAKLTTHGFQIVACLVNDIEPDKRVKSAMNEINTQERLLHAATTRAEAAKTSVIMEAQGKAESDKLSGQGLARQRKAIVFGLSESIKEFSESVPGSTTDEVMQMVMLNQYFDTLKSFSHNSIVLLPTVPKSDTEMMQIVETASLLR